MTTHCAFTCLDPAQCQASIYLALLLLLMLITEPLFTTKFVTIQSYLPSALNRHHTSPRIPQFDPLEQLEHPGSSPPKNRRNVVRRRGASLQLSTSPTTR